MGLLEPGLRQAVTAKVEGGNVNAVPAASPHPACNMTSPSMTTSMQTVGTDLVI